MKIRMDFRNGEASELRVIIEPWAEEYLLAADEILSVTFNGDGVPLIERSGDRLVVHGWAGSTMSVERDGVHILGAGRIPVPY